METDKTSKQVIARAATILKIISQSVAGMNITQLSRTCGLPRSTVHRMVATLEEQQLVINAKEGVRLGPALLSLATAAHTDFVTAARPAVVALGRRTKETIDVSVSRGLHAVLVDQYASDRELRVVSAPGTAFPVHCTAHGKAMLATMDDSVLANLLPEMLPASTSKTASNRVELLAEIAHIRQQGFATDNEEHAEGVCGLAFAINSGISSLYAVSIAVPVLRFQRNKEVLLAELCKTRAEIESVLYQPR